jgi:hypothetical protein
MILPLILSIKPKHMKKLITLSSFFIWFLIGSCEKIEKPSDTNIKPVFKVQFLSGICTSTFLSSKYDEVIITDLQTFQSFIDSIISSDSYNDCEIVNVELIDFDKYILAGKKSNGGGCSVTSDYSVIKDDINKKVIYNISVDYIGSCRLAFSSMHWALIPRLPENYTFEIKIDNRY